VGQFFLRQSLLRFLFITIHIHEFSCDAISYILNINFLHVTPESLGFPELIPFGLSKFYLRKLGFWVWDQTMSKTCQTLP
jgi:hypothetical protein